MKVNQAWGIFTHLFQLPRQGRGTGVLIKGFIPKLTIQMAT
jgi:hypothetical protein